MIETIVRSVVLLAVLGLFGYLFISKAHIQGQLADAEKSTAALTVANLELKSELEAQNSAILAAQQASIKAKQDADAAIKSAEIQSSVYIKKAQTILALKPIGNDCSATVKLVNNYIVGLK